MNEKYDGWHREAKNFQRFLNSMPEETLTEFKDVWFKDLREYKVYQSEEELLQTANAILKYYGSCYRAYDFEIDPEDNRYVNWCFEYVGLNED